MTNKYGVLLRAWGPNDDPAREARYREYVVEADDADGAIDDAVEEAKNGFSTGIIGIQDSYDILEVEPYE